MRLPSCAGTLLLVQHGHGADTVGEPPPCRQCHEDEGYSTTARVCRMPRHWPGGVSTGSPALLPQRVATRR
jgi:hypothetical protein